MSKSEQTEAAAAVEERPELGMETWETKAYTEEEFETLVGNQARIDAALAAPLRAVAGPWAELGVEMRPGKIFAALARIMARVRPVSKDRQNQEFRYSYRGIDDFCDMLQPLFGEAGVVVLPVLKEWSQTTSERKNREGRTTYVTETTAYYVWLFLADDGSYVGMPSSGYSQEFSGDKGLWKCQAMALKYALAHMFLVPTGSDDDTEASATPPPRERHAAPPPAKGKREWDGRQDDPRVPAEDERQLPAEELAPLNAERVAYLQRGIDKLYKGKADKGEAFVRWASENRTGVLTELTAVEGDRAEAELGRMFDDQEARAKQKGGK